MKPPAIREFRHIFHSTDFFVRGARLLIINFLLQAAIFLGIVLEWYRPVISNSEALIQNHYLSVYTSAPCCFLLSKGHVSCLMGYFRKWGSRWVCTCPKIIAHRKELDGAHQIGVIFPWKQTFLLRQNSKLLSSENYHPSWSGRIAAFTCYVDCHDEASERSTPWNKHSWYTLEWGRLFVVLNRNGRE